MQHRLRTFHLAGLATVAAVTFTSVGCSANGASGAGSTTSAVTLAPTVEVTTATSTPETSVVSNATITTAAFDFGDLGRDGYCAVTKEIVDATSALVPTATPDAVKNGFGTMKSSLGVLAAKAATDQRPQFGAAVAVLEKASVAIEANGFDVTKTQSQLSVLDPDGALVGAITVVITQRQAACG